MTIGENLAYPLKVRKIAASETERRVKESLDLVELADFVKRFPGQLSGGQKQRVALARSLIFEPSIVLMDEPLGALDKNLREQMQFEIKRLHEDLGFTAIYVTHDQTEALTMSDRIAVFNDGIVEQYATPEMLYEQPSNSFVANFIGENNCIPGTVTTIENGQAQVRLAGGTLATTGNPNCPQTGDPCTLTTRPENLFIANAQPLANSIAADFTTRLFGEGKAALIKR